MTEEATQQETREQEQTPEQAQTPDKIAWLPWLAEQADDVKTAYEEHTHGLKSALAAEREERKTLARQLKELGKDAEAGSELQGRLEQTVGALEEAEAKAQFFEDAAPVVVNLRVAWMYAKAAGLVGKDGRVDMAKLRIDAPQLFERKAAPPANAGNGAAQPVPPPPDMNAFIRRGAGRR